MNLKVEFVEENHLIEAQADISWNKQQKLLNFNATILIFWWPYTHLIRLFSLISTKYITFNFTQQFS